MARIVLPQWYGGPEVLAVREVPVPRAGRGEVVVQVRAAGMNPIDWKLYNGTFHNTGELPSFGMECAGVITEIGSDVSDLAWGRR